MIVNTSDKRSTGVPLSERCHHVVHLCFKQALCLDLPVVSSKVLGKVQLERCPNEFLRVELA